MPSSTARRSRPLLVLSTVLAIVCVPASPAYAVTDVTSSNWSGYVVRGHTTRVDARWVVPRVDCTDPDQPFTDVSFWIGIGGVPEGGNPARTLTQEGFDIECNEGRADYFAFYELETGNVGDVRLPTDRYPVRPDDRMSASITHLQDATFRLVIRNHGNVAGTNPAWAANFRQQLSYPAGTNPSLNSGEAIVERPSFQGILPPLAKFNTVEFTRFRVNRTSADEFNATTDRVTLLQRPADPPTGGNVLARPGGLRNDGGFTVTWVNYGRPRPA